eukprot:2944164-Alexandrium_andersonii.AAC.1
MDGSKVLPPRLPDSLGGGDDPTAGVAEEGDGPGLVRRKLTQTSAQLPRIVVTGRLRRTRTHSTDVRLLAPGDGSTQHTMRAPEHARGIDVPVSGPSLIVPGPALRWRGRSNPKLRGPSVKHLPLESGPDHTRLQE